MGLVHEHVRTLILNGSVRFASVSSQTLTCLLPCKAVPVLLRLFEEFHTAELQILLSEIS